MIDRDVSREGSTVGHTCSISSTVASTTKRVAVFSCEDFVKSIDKLLSAVQAANPMVTIKQPITTLLGQLARKKGKQPITRLS